MPRVLNDKPHILRLRKVDAGHDIRGFRDVDRVACVEPELAWLGHRRKRIARFVLSPGETYFAGIRVTARGSFVLAVMSVGIQASGRSWKR